MKIDKSLQKKNALKAPYELCTIPSLQKTYNNSFVRNSLKFKPLFRSYYCFYGIFVFFLKNESTICRNNMGKNSCLFKEIFLYPQLFLMALAEQG